MIPTAPNPYFTQTLPDVLPPPVKHIVCSYLDESADYSLAMQPLNLDKSGDLLRDATMHAVKNALMSTGFVPIKEKILANAFAESTYPKFQIDYKNALNQIFDEIRSEGYDVNLRGIVLCLPEKHYKQCIIKSEAGANLIKSGLDQCGLNLCSTSIGKTPQHKLTIVFGSIEGLMKKSRNLDLYAEKHQGSVFHLIPKTAVTQT